MNFDSPLKTLRGEELKDVSNGKEELVTLKTVCVEALLSVYPKEEINGLEKMKRFKLAYRIENANGEAILVSVDELKMLKDLIGQRFAPLIVGAAYSLLDPSEMNLAKE